MKLDKQAHFWAGAAICACAIILTGQAEAGVLAAIIAGVAKEAVDRFGFGRVEFADFVATVAGAIVPAGIVAMGWSA